MRAISSNAREMRCSSLNPLNEACHVNVASVQSHLVSPFIHISEGQHHSYHSIPLQQPERLFESCKMGSPAPPDANLMVRTLDPTSMASPTPLSAATKLEDTERKYCRLVDLTNDFKDRYKLRHDNIHTFHFIFHEINRRWHLDEAYRVRLA